MTVGEDSRTAWRAVRQQLESLASAGILELPRVVAAPAVTAANLSAAPSLEPRNAAAAEVTRTAPLESRPGAGAGRSWSPLAQVDAALLAERATALQALRERVAACSLCSELACGRTHTVFGAGHSAARICFFGEAPGADEDASGEPFVGKAGQLLTKIIEACRLSRDQVYILNVLKCRPPGNRRPLPDEIANCRAFFEQQLALIAPEVICCLGATAAQALLETTETIGQLRGRWFAYRSAAVICTYHPSYLLRNPAAKRQVWDDMKMLMRHLGVTL